MRFEPNQQYAFVCIKYETKNGRKRSDGMGGSSFQPWEDKLLGIEIKMLTCAEHHKVPSEWDTAEPPELKYDGFIFTDVDDVKWSNQYPRASYGQVSDTADRIASRMLPDVAAYRALPEGTSIEMELATYRLERVESAIYETQAVVNKLEAGTDVDKYLPLETIRTNLAAFIPFRDSLKAALEKAVGQTLEILPLRYGSEKKVLPGHFRVKFANEEEEAILF